MISVFILEDTPDKLRQVATALVESGLVETANIDTATDAATARRRLGDTTYDLLILDLSAPERVDRVADGGTGMRLLEDLFEGESLRMPGRIIGLTAFEDLASTFEAGFRARGVVLVRYSPSGVEWREPVTMCVRQLAAWKRAEGEAGKSYDWDLGIICALDVELQAVERLSWGWTSASVRSDPALYLEGRFERQGRTRRVVATLCPRMGMSAASISTTKLIQAYRPAIVAMPGITAALKGRANIGDVIVADECWDWGMGKWMKKGDRTTFVPGPHHLALDADLRAAAVRLARDGELLGRIRRSWQGATPDSELRVVVGPVASGAAVIATQEMSEQIVAQHRKLVGIEMEAYGVYAAAAEAALPRPRAIALKAVSDFADDAKGDEWRHYAAYTSAAVLQAIVDTY